MKNVLKILGALFVLRMLFRMLGGQRRRRWAAKQGLGYGSFSQGGPVPVDGLATGTRHQVPVA